MIGSVTALRRRVTHCAAYRFLIALAILWAPFFEHIANAADTPALSQTELLTSADHVWSDPVRLGIAANAPYISGDGLEIVFIGTAKGTLGENDLWMRKRVAADLPFGPRASLAAPVNSAASELNPWLSVDGLTLVFGSARDGGVGASD